MGTLKQVVACLPDAVKVWVIVIAIFTAGMSVGVTVMRLQDIPLRMLALEQRVETIEDNQRATMCLTFALAQHENPHRCDVWMDENMRMFVAAFRR